MFLFYLFCIGEEWRITMFKSIDQSEGEPVKVVETVLQRPVLLV